MLAKKGILLVAFALLATFANAAKTITPTKPELVDGCYQISNAEELYYAAFSYLENDTCIKLTADIVVNENVIKEGTLNVADTANFVIWENFSFYKLDGVFDGQGHTISGLYVNDSIRYNVGLISYVGDAIPDEDDFTDLVIRDVHLVDSYFRGEDRIGGLVGEVDDGINLTIEHCSVDGVIMADGAAGGIIGYATNVYKNLVVLNSYNSANVTADSRAGGIIGGITWDGTFTIVNTYNVGSISGKEEIGGIIGYLHTQIDKLNMMNVFNVGPVSASVKYGGYVIGRVDDWYLEKIYADNVFYLSTGESEIGSPMTEEQFANGTVASIMHDYNYGGVNGSIWGQKVGTDPLPNFSGTVSGAVVLPTITLTLDTGSAVPWTREIAVGFRHRIPDVEREGYELFGWYDNAELTGEPVTHLPDTQTTDVKFWGYYERVYKVTLETDGGTVPVDSVDSYVHTVGAKLPNGALREGYIFAGWYAKSDFSGNPVDSITAADEGDKTFYAKWDEIRSPKKNAQGCYAISDAGELYGFAAIMNGPEAEDFEEPICAVLTQDIVVNKNVLDSTGKLNKAEAPAFVEWTPIQFMWGTFDGQMHTISGLFVVDTLTREDEYAGLKASDKKPVGFIGSMVGLEEEPAVVKNLGIVGSYFMSDAPRVGAVVGYVVESWKDYNLYAEIRNTFNTSSVYSTYKYGNAAGLVGYVGSYSHLLVENCYNLGRIESEDDAAGLAGVGDDEQIRVVNSYNAGKVYGERRNHLVLNICQGCTFDAGTIVNSYYLYSSFGNSTNGEIGGISVNQDELANGKIALALHIGENGSIWGQNVGEDPYPVLSGVVKNSEAVSYKVTFHTFEGDTATYFDHYVSGVYKRLPGKVSVENKDMVFAGWYKTADFSGERQWGISSSNEGDLEFYAKYELRPFELIVKPNSWSYGEIVGLEHDYYGSYKYGTDVTFEAKPYSGYEFYYWKDDTTNTNPVRTVTISKDTTFEAVFGLFRYALNYHTFDGDTTTYVTRYVKGTAITLPSTVKRRGFTFKGWYADSTLSGEQMKYITKNDTGSFDFYAKWERLRYKVSVSVVRPGAGRVIGLKDTLIYEYEEVDTVEARPIDGYRFAYWADDKTNTNPILAFKVLSDTTLVANFEWIAPSSSSTNSSSIGEPPKSSSSSSNKDGVLTVAQIPQFALDVVGRDILVSSVSESARFYTVLDMQGHVLRKGSVYGKNFAIPVKSAGTYLIRIGSQVQRVSVK